MGKTNYLQETLLLLEGYLGKTHQNIMLHALANDLKALRERMEKDYGLISKKVEN